MIRRIQSPVIVRTVYSRIFRHSLSNWKVSGCIPVIRHLSLLWLYVRYTASDTFRILTHSPLCFSGICQHIHSCSELLRYSRILRHQGIFSLIQAYSARCVTLAYAQPCLAIFWALTYLKPVRWLTSNPMKRWPGIFRTLPWGIMQPYSGISKPYATLAYAETWDTRNPGIFRTFP